MKGMVIIMFFLYINKNFNTCMDNLKEIIEYSISNKKKKEVVVVYSAQKTYEPFVDICRNIGVQCVNLTLKDFDKIVGTKGIIDFKNGYSKYSLYNTYHEFHKKGIKVLYWKGKLYTYTDEIDEKVTLERTEMERQRLEAMARYNHDCRDEKYFISEEDCHLHFYKPVNMDYFNFQQY